MCDHVMDIIIFKIGSRATSLNHQQSSVVASFRDGEKKRIGDRRLTCHRGRQWLLAGRMYFPLSNQWNWMMNWPMNFRYGEEAAHHRIYVYSVNCVVDNNGQMAWTTRDLCRVFLGQEDYMLLLQLNDRPQSPDRRHQDQLGPLLNLPWTTRH